MKDISYTYTRRLSEEEKQIMLERLNPNSNVIFVNFKQK